MSFQPILKMLMPTKNSQKPNVTRLAKKPSLAQMQDLFRITASKPNPNETAGPSNIRNPPRTPKIEPHPKPGQPRNWSTAKNHGDIANAKLIFPNKLDFIVF